MAAPIPVLVLVRHGTWPARRSLSSSASRAKRHPGVGPSAQTLGRKFVSTAYMNDDEYWSPLVPELTVMNLVRSLLFYTSAGFAVRYQRDDPPFAYLEMGKAQIMLEQQNPEGWNIEPLDRPLGRGINFQLEVVDAESTLSALSALGFFPFRDLQDNWYAVSGRSEEGQREFLVQDPDGYLWRFAQYLGRRVAA